MSKYHEYYDRLNIGKKDYENEILRILKKFREVCGDAELLKILEIGSGTGNHTSYLCDNVKHVYAVDIDPEMNKVAALKLKDRKVSFYTQIKDVKEENFPLCVMMWHVLNYFPDLETMRQVFEGVHSKLEEGGVFIFDAWNGVAVIRDLPKHATNSFEVDGCKIIHELRGTTDLMALTTTILNHIEVYEDHKLKDQFAQEVVHYIWTAKVVTDILKSCGFEVIKVTKSGNYDLEADHTDWKVAYVARKMGE